MNQKNLWNDLMCPFVSHALSSIMVLDQHKEIIESSYWTSLLTHPNLSLVIFKK